MDIKLRTNDNNIIKTGSVLLPNNTDLIIDITTDQIEFQVIIKMDINPEHSKCIYKTTEGNAIIVHCENFDFDDDGFMQPLGLAYIDNGRMLSLLIMSSLYETGIRKIEYTFFKEINSSMTLPINSNEEETNDQESSEEVENLTDENEE